MMSKQPDSMQNNTMPLITPNKMAKIDVDTVQ
jgi:hypothetical protein